MSLFRSFYEPFADESCSFFEEESLDAFSAEESRPHPMGDSSYASLALSTNSMMDDYPQRPSGADLSCEDPCLQEVIKSIAALKKAQFHASSLSAAQRATISHAIESLARLCSAIAPASLTYASSPNSEDPLLAESHPFDAPPESTFDFPDYSQALPPPNKTAPEPQQEQGNPQPAINFTVLTFTTDDQPTTQVLLPLAPPPPRPRPRTVTRSRSAHGKSHAHAGAEYSSIKWRSQPYGPRQLKVDPKSLMDEFVFASPLQLQHAQPLFQPAHSVNKRVKQQQERAHEARLKASQQKRQLN